jgi:hypothetical protein
VTDAHLVILARRTHVEGLTAAAGVLTLTDKEAVELLATL